MARKKLLEEVEDEDEEEEELEERAGEDENNSKTQSKCVPSSASENERKSEWLKCRNNKYIRKHADSSIEIFLDKKYLSVCDSIMSTFTSHKNERKKHYKVASNLNYYLIYHSI